MKRAVYLLVNGFIATTLLGAGWQCRAQSVPSASPVGSPASLTDPKDPPFITGTTEVEKNATGETADIPNAAPDTHLQSEVQEALSKVPELSNDTLQVLASPDGLELTGTVVTGRERQAAMRIAQSYARGRKVVDHIVISGRNAPPAEDAKAKHQANAQP